MLTHIDIRNLVAIQSVQLALDNGTTAITGETGTGKSILMDAIGLGLGERATGHPVRPGTDRADITLTFDLNHLPMAAEWLKAHELDSPGGECIVRRILTPDGRSRSYVNGTPLPLSRLKELAGHLIQIHGQHTQQSLLETKEQLLLLDHFGESLTLAEKVSACALAWRTLHNEITALRIEMDKERAHHAFLQTQWQEFETLQLKPDEFQTLDQLQRELSHADASLAQLNQAIEWLNGNDQSILTVLRQLNRTVSSLHPLYPAAQSWRDTLDTITVQLNDLDSSLQHAAEQTKCDPEKLAAIETRLSLLFELARKHRVPPEQLFSLQQQLATRCQQQQQGEKHLASLLEETARIEQTWQEAASLLSTQRQAAAEKLEEEINRLLPLLALGHATFQVGLEPTTTPLSSFGYEQPIFCLRTSPDQPMQPVAAIASGGELSRLSLALHCARAKKQATPTLIFDEVDTGIGGGTAETIGKLLRQLGESHQVLCVTHTPQVAAQLHHHVCVQKHITGEATRIEIASLDPEEKIREIARMLGGVEMTRKTLAHAREMAEKAGAITT